MGMTKFGLSQHVSQETASGEEHNRDSRWNGCLENALANLKAGTCRVPAHKRNIGLQEKESVSIQITRHHGKQGRRRPLCLCLTPVSRRRPENLVGSDAFDCGGRLHRTFFSYFHGVVTHPFSRPLPAKVGSGSANCAARARRSVEPFAVRGKLVAMCIRSGTSKALSRALQNSRSSPSVAFSPGRRMTAAWTFSPYIASASPNAAASSTFELDNSAASMSLGAIFSPPRLIISFILPVKKI